MCAGVGAELHLIEPLGFSLSDKHLKRAGLDYHDLALTTVHKDLTAAMAAFQGRRIFAFSSSGKVHHTDISYQEGDVLLFGTEPTGLTQAALTHPQITEIVRIPMLPARRSMNLSNAAAVAAYELWRQLGFRHGK